MLEEFAHQVHISILKGKIFAVAAMDVAGKAVVMLTLHILALHKFRVHNGFTIPAWVIIRHMLELQMASLRFYFLLCCLLSTLNLLNIAKRKTISYYRLYRPW